MVQPKIVGLPKRNAKLLYYWIIDSSATLKEYDLSREYWSTQILICVLVKATTNEDDTEPLN